MGDITCSINSFIAKNKPSILTGLGIVGIGATAAISFLCGMKANKILANNKEETLLGKIKQIAVPCILPSLGAVIGSSALICRANYLHTRREKALVMIANRNEHNYSSLTQAVASATGTAASELLLKDPDKEASDGKCLFYEPYSATWFESTLQDVCDAEYNLNRNFTLRGYVAMKEVYAFFGLPNIETMEDEYIGWSYDNGIDDGYQWIDFYHREKEDQNGKKYYIIEYPFAPRYLWPEDKN